MVFSVPFLTYNKLSRPGLRRGGIKGLISQILFAWWLPLGKHPSGKWGASWGSMACQQIISYSHPGPQPRFSFRGCGETLPPWRPTWLAKRQGMQSALLGPPFPNSSWGGTPGNKMHSLKMEAFLPYLSQIILSQQPISYKCETFSLLSIL